MVMGPGIFRFMWSFHYLISLSLPSVGLLGGQKFKEILHFHYNKFNKVMSSYRSPSSRGLKIYIIDKDPIHIIPLYLVCLRDGQELRIKKGFPL